MGGEVVVLKPAEKVAQAHSEFNQNSRSAVGAETKSSRALRSKRGAKGEREVEVEGGGIAETKRCSSSAAGAGAMKQKPPPGTPLLVWGRLLLPEAALSEEKHAFNWLARARCWRAALSKKPRMEIEMGNVTLMIWEDGYACWLKMKMSA
ncbi:uncharacterized protein THITE_2148785 [Thermothielavioides terrestris NRRL 8126]|uniref:Uncharacterized protein n=1 Tax=Thermothielavioides terrestris (strain ATCC 38088 / NRRL 8126) TaxID=578455 RepID=G2QSX7_THETT|nr:uncharacterized protein THITE_2148785 [Thermothielavioides terrestris NRRL 8126]AEO62702.1 hypothetical protein THITE_2148785 [Thermothielavioides terrestris NRRL 8126]